MITEKILFMLSELKLNPNILINVTFKETDLDIIPISFFEMDRKGIEQEINIKMTDSDLLYFKLGGLSISWESTLEDVDYVLTGGVKFNGLLETLTFYSDFWKGAFSLAPDVKVPEKLKHFEQLGWFERQAWDDGRYGCFIKQSGNFPPPIVFYNMNHYVPMNMDLEKYLTTMFENYAVKGWQFFYIDVTNDFTDLDDTLRDMRVASEQLPLLFPDKDWSYHINKYEETKRKLGV